MYPVKVKDYTRLGGWLALFAVLTALTAVLVWALHAKRA